MTLVGAVLDRRPLIIFCSKVGRSNLETTGLQDSQQLLPKRPRLQF